MVTALFIMYKPSSKKITSSALLAIMAAAISSPLAKVVVLAETSEDYVTEAKSSIVLNIEGIKFPFNCRFVPLNNDDYFNF